MIVDSIAGPSSTISRVKKSRAHNLILEVFAFMQKVMTVAGIDEMPLRDVR